MGSGLKSKKKNKWMPMYMPSEEQMKHRDFCIRNNIRISPLGIYGDNDHWKIGINIGEYKKGETPHLSPNIFTKDNFSYSYYQMCKYYYDKREK